MREILEHVKQDLVGVLITLGENSLPIEDKIKESEKILLEAIEFINLKIK